MTTTRWKVPNRVTGKALMGGIKVCPSCLINCYENTLPEEPWNITFQGPKFCDCTVCHHRPLKGLR